MGIVHVAIYDAAVAIDGGYRPFEPTPAAPPNTSPEAAIATAAYDTLTGLQPQLGANQAILDGDYTAYMAAVPDGTAAELAAKQNGMSVGEQVAQAVLAHAGERRSWLQHHPRRPRSAGIGPRRVAAQRHGAGARALPTRNAAACTATVRRSSGPTAPTP